MEEEEESEMDYGNRVLEEQIEQFKQHVAKEKIKLYSANIDSGRLVKHITIQME